MSLVVCKKALDFVNNLGHGANVCEIKSRTPSLRQQIENYNEFCRGKNLNAVELVLKLFVTFKL